MCCCCCFLLFCCRWLNAKNKGKTLKINKQKQQREQQKQQRQQIPKRSTNTQDQKNHSKLCALCLCCCCKWQEACGSSRRCGNKRWQQRDTQSAVKRTWAKLLSAEFVIFKLGRHQRGRRREGSVCGCVCTSVRVCVCASKVSNVKAKSLSHSSPHSYCVCHFDSTCRSRGYANVICIYSPPAAPPTPPISVSRYVSKKQTSYFLLYQPSMWLIAGAATR